MPRQHRRTAHHRRRRRQRRRHRRDEAHCGARRLSLHPARVLASFSTVWSRSRLMRIEGGGSVPQHSDMNYHWFQPRARARARRSRAPRCASTARTRACTWRAGEAWIFDNWREHRVENPAPDARVHLVADTAGTSAFWRLVAKAQSMDFGQANPQARLRRLRPRRATADPDRALQCRARDAARRGRAARVRPARRPRLRGRAARSPPRRPASSWES